MKAQTISRSFAILAIIIQAFVASFLVGRGIYMVCALEQNGLTLLVAVVALVLGCILAQMAYSNLKELSAPALSEQTAPH
jgi:hypothetical protein